MWRGEFAETADGVGGKAGAKRRSRHGQQEWGIPPEPKRPRRWLGNGAMPRRSQGIWRRATCGGAPGGELLAGKRGYGPPDASWKQKG